MMRAFPKRLLFSILFFCAGASAIFAESIIMRNGQVINGKIVNQTRNEVVFDTAQGRIVLRKQDIRRIQYIDTVDAKGQEDAKKVAEQKRLEAEQATRDAQFKKEAEEKEKADKKKAEDARLAEEKKREEDKKNQEAKKNEKPPGLTEEQIRQQVRDEFRKAEQEKSEAERRKAEEARRLADMKLKTPTLLGAFMRSAVVPGWGQYYQGRNKPALAYGTLFLGAIPAAFNADIVYKSRRQVYRESANAFLFSTPLSTRLFGFAQSDEMALGIFLYGTDYNAGQFRKFRNAANRAKAVRGAIGLFYAWNLADIFLFAPKTSLGVGTDKDQLQFAVTHRF